MKGNAPTSQNDRWGVRDMSKNKQKDNKNRQYRLRMTNEEFDVLTQASDRLGKTKSQIIREALIMYYDYLFDN